MAVAVTEQALLVHLLSENEPEEHGALKALLSMYLGICTGGLRLEKE